LKALKCLTFAAAVLVAAVLMTGAAFAGDYHSGTQLVCSDCHTMHYSVSHSYTGGAAPGDLAGGPNPLLLKKPAADLCLACHDGSATAGPDVLNANTGTHVREAGALSRLTGNTGGYDVYMGHTLGSTASAPGSSPAWSAAAGLTCTDCHGAHNSTGSNRNIQGTLGMNAWRNVNRRAGNNSSMVAPLKDVVISYEVGANTGAYDISEGSAALGNFATHYSIDNVTLEEPVSTSSGVAVWCMKCHTNYHGSSADGNMNNGTAWLRHPTADADLSTVDITRWNALTTHPKVMGTGATATPTCLTCHKAHGNLNPFGLIYMNGAGGTVTEEGDGGTGFRDTCRQCHNKGA
jgi:hypothetical protein